MLNKIISWDARRDLIIPGDFSTTIDFCRDHWMTLCAQAIADHGAFFVALSGGSTPQSIFQAITSAPYDTRIEWTKVHLFWSDERAVPPENPQSNYHMAMQAGLGKMPIPRMQIHRMHAEENIEDNALLYEKTLRETLKARPLDLIMLGLGTDGHTASLFPGTKALEEKERLVAPNYLPDKNLWRMTFTFTCINQASHIVFYVLGADKKHILADVLKGLGTLFPAQRVGTPKQHALWIADQAAAFELKR